MRTDYATVRFCYPARVLPGKPSTELMAREGIKLVRVTHEGRDDLLVVGPGLVGVEVPWTNIASATRAPVEERPHRDEKPSATARKGSE